MQLVIDGREITMPVDFTIDKWIEIQKWTGDTDKLISVSLGLPIATVKLIPEKTKTLAVALIITALYPSWNKEVKPNIISFEKITLGQFIDLEVYISRDYRKTMLDLIKVLYNTDVNQNELFGQYWPGVERYLRWRITLYKQYKNLFNVGDDTEYENEDITDIKTDLAYGWYDHIMTLADEKFLNIEPVLNKPLIEALNYLAWYKTKIEREAEAVRVKQAKAQMR
jgi:hypothetical protein